MNEVVLRGPETFSDTERWDELSRKYKMRLPLWRFPVTTGRMRTWLKKLGKPVEVYLSDNNEKNLKHFHQLNPDWPLRAWCALQLENLAFDEFLEGKELIPEEAKRTRPKKVVDDSTY